MRNRVFLSASVLSCLAVPLAHAQVSVQPRALDQLAPPPIPPPDAESPAAKAPPRRSAPPRPVRATPPPPLAPAHGAVNTGAVYGPPRPPPPSMTPTAAPPLPVIPPPIEVPTRPLPPPPPLPVVATAAGRAMPIANGLRVTFGRADADFNPATEAAIRAFVKATPHADTAIFTLTAMAAVDPEDPSTPRRLALSRAVGVRAVLVGEGIASPRIIVRVQPAADAPAADAVTPADDGPPDRVDLVATPARPRGGPSDPAVPAAEARP